MDPEIQRKVLATYGESTDDITIDKLVSVVEAEEMGKRSQGLLDSSSSGGLNQITDYKSRSNGAKLDRVNLTGQSQSAQSTCGHCGGTGHSSNRQEREGVCKAYNILCNKCKKLGHYRCFCKK